jgi:hypothetical protein
MSSSKVKLTRGAKLYLALFGKEPPSAVDDVYTRETKKKVTPANSVVSRNAIAYRKKKPKDP